MHHGILVISLQGPGDGKAENRRSMQQHQGGTRGDGSVLCVGCGCVYRIDTWENVTQGTSFVHTRRTKVNLVSWTVWTIFATFCRSVIVLYQVLKGVGKISPLSTF